MPEVHVLPGERIEARLRPSPLLYVPEYVRVALVAAWGLALWGMASTPAWRLHEPGSDWRFWTHFWGTTGSLYAYTMLGVAALGLLSAWVMRRPWWQGVLAGAAAGAVAAAGAAVWMPGKSWAVAAACSIVSLLLVAALEAERRSRAIVYTNLRLVVARGRRRGGTAHVHYEDITDIDTVLPPLGRRLDYGHLVPVLSSQAGGGEFVVRGVRPLSLAKELLSAMVQHATASAELKRAGDTESRLYRALRALGADPHPNTVR